MRVCSKAGSKGQPTVLDKDIPTVVDRLMGKGARQVACGLHSSAALTDSGE